MAEFRLETERLVLREWREEDVAALQRICADPVVMRFIGPPQSLGEVREGIERQRAYQREVGHCYWALERRSDRALLGFCGLQPEPPGTPFADQPDIGWRLASAAWGQGYAHEAASAVLDWGWQHLPGNSIWAVTVPANTRSWRLMQRLGMRRRPQFDFDHPNVRLGNPLRAHISYEARRPA